MNQMGIKNLINRNAPAGEQVAFINEREADLLRRSGGSGRTDNNPYGIPSYVGGGEPDDYGGDSGDTSGFGGEGDSYGGDSPDLDYGRPTEPGTANSVNPEGRTTDQIVFDDNYNKMGSFGNLHHDLNPQGREGLYDGSSSSGGQGFFGTIGNFLSKTARNIVNNPGTFLMNTAVNLTPYGALAQIISGVATGKSVAGNFSGATASPFMEALGRKGRDLGINLGAPSDVEKQAVSVPLSFSPEQASQLNNFARNADLDIYGVSNKSPVATGDPINLNPEPVSDPFTSASSIGVDSMKVPDLTPSVSKVAPAGGPAKSAIEFYNDLVTAGRVQSKNYNPANYNAAKTRIQSTFGNNTNFAEKLAQERQTEKLEGFTL